MSEREEVFDVVTHGKREAGTNTLVLGGVDLVVPLEMDLDDDPLQDDEVRLVRADGHFERTLLASDEDVTIDAESERLIYRFRDVPPGAYAIHARIAADRWACVMDGILVTRSGARWSGKDLGDALDGFAPAAEAPLPAPVDPPSPELQPFYEFAGDDTE